MIETFRDVGRDMFLTGLVSSHTGSMSVRSDDRATITRRGVMLGRLRPEDIMELVVADDAPEEAPDETIVHQAVYRATDALAVIYARPPATMAMALIEDRLSPANGEGSDYFGSAPVLVSQRAINSPDIAQLISRTLRENRIVALRGQGVFARGADVEDAFHMVSLLEEMCKVVQIFRTLSREEQQPAGREREWHERQNSLSPFRNGARSENAGRRPPARTGPPRGGGTSQPPRRSDSPPPRLPTNGGGTGGDNRNTTRPRRGPHRTT